MRKLILLLLLSAPLAAQAPNIVPPTNLNALMWDYVPTTAQLPLSGIDHFDVQWANSTLTGPWTSTGKALTATLPALTAGAYTARVRACPNAASTGCSVSDPFAFTVSVAPAASPSGMRLIAK